jgi:excisionase family DNA binding protein
MEPNTVNAQHGRGSPVPAPIPPELLETVARALAAALIPPPRQPPPPETAGPPDFLTAAQLAARLGVSRETVRRLAIAGALPHTVVCRGSRKTTRRFPRRFADDFAASGLDTADPRSVTAYAVAPVALAVVVDRVVAVLRRHVLAYREPSAWAALGRVAPDSSRTPAAQPKGHPSYTSAPLQARPGLGWAGSNERSSRGR